MTIKFYSSSPMSSHMAKTDTIQTNRELGKSVPQKINGSSSNGQEKVELVKQSKSSNRKI